MRRKVAVVDAMTPPPTRRRHSLTVALSVHLSLGSLALSSADLTRLLTLAAISRNLALREVFAHKSNKINHISFTTQSLASLIIN